METLQVDSNILLTMISINMTIIGLTSLAEKKTASSASQFLLD